ncbi:MAG TPA: NAD(P)-binding domain-containing protein [Armatimonadota bacterium]|jgi:pyrroline-5-carboxylate reductase
MEIDSEMGDLQQFLGDSPLGIFGAGHLGCAVANSLLTAGFPNRQLLIGHRGSPATAQRLVEAGLSDFAVDCDTLVREAKMLLYIVRPQDYRAIAEFHVREDALLISFLAGVPVSRIPAPLAEGQRVRVMPSAPDTICKKNGIAALYPADNVIVHALLAALSLRVFPLRNEETLHAFTAFGPCLPIALTYWEGLGNRVDDNELLDTAAQYGLPDFSEMLAWARAIQPRQLSVEEQHRYVLQAATPGGVTEAILREIDKGQRLSLALERGVQRSHELAVV